MFRHTLMLLVTTVLASLADHEFFKGRRNNVNSNANSNAIYGGYENGIDRDVDRSRERGYGDNRVEGLGLPNRPPTISQDPFNPGYVGSPRYSNRGRGGLPKYGYDVLDEDDAYGYEDCDDNLNPIGRKVPGYNDDDDIEDIRRIRGYRGYGEGRIFNNANANANNNAIGMKYRRVAYWPAMNTPKRSDIGKYETGYRGTNVNSNANSNAMGGRRSNVNSNLNVNELNPVQQQYGGRARERDYEERERIPFYDNLGYKPQRGGYGTPENSRDRMNQKNPALSWPAPYVDREEPTDDDNYINNPSEYDNYNLNSNTNIVGRRSSNMNANTNSNVFARPRRSVETSTIGKSDVTEKAARRAIDDNREKSRGAIYPSLL